MLKIRFSLRQKLIISYIFVVLVPVLFVGLTLTSTMRQLARNNAVREASESVGRVKRLVADAIRLSTVISNRFYIDRDLENLLDRRYGSTWDVVSSYRDYLDFDVYPEISSEIVMIRAYSPNPTLLENWRIMKATADVLESAWYQEAMVGKGKISWNYLWFPELEQSYYTLTRQITGINPVGVLTISLNPNFLHDILRQESFETLLTDKNGIVIAASDWSLVGSAIDEELLSPISQDTDSFRVHYRDTWYEAITDAVTREESSAEMHIVSLFPVERIASDANRASKLGQTVMLISLALSFLLILVLSRVLTNRIRLLSHRTHRVASGDLDCSLLIDGTDEISALSHDLNSMVNSLQNLYSTQEHLKIRQRDIRFKMLANQVNPHFLFNVLETIRMKALGRGDGDIAEIVKKLGKIFRRNLEIGNEPIPLAVELDTVESYLEIQRFRFGDRLGYHVWVEDDAQDHLVLPLIVQPLVENAVIHGIERQAKQGVITVHAGRHDSFLRIVIKDNGVGIDKFQLQRLNDHLNSEGNGETHIGIKNVHQRIMLFYGERARLKLSSTLGVGTEVEILLPWDL